MNKRTFYIIGDQVLILFSFLLAATIKGDDPWLVMQARFPWFIGLAGIHFILALFFDKYNFANRTGIRRELLPILYTNFAFAGLISILLVFFGQTGISRALFFGTLGFVTFGELFGGIIINLFREANRKDYTYEPNGKEYPYLSATEAKPEKPATDPRTFLTVRGQAIRLSIIEEIGQDAFNYLKHHVPLGASSIVLSVTTRINILTLPSRGIDTIVNLQRVNNHRYVNKFFEAVNARLPLGGIYAGCGETHDVRKARFLRRFTPAFGWFLYSIDFLIFRIAPKLNITQRLYFSITRGRNRVMSRAEILGRLYSCGFEVLDEEMVNGLMFFVARKLGAPAFDNTPTYGPLIRLKRIGMNGKEISVYKLRTMHPYAEYLQPYIHSRNQLQEGGKFANDFRVSTLGHLMRKLWIDELPMLANLLRRDLKLVGVRPLSPHYFGLYTPELQQRRIRFRPGLIPPFYADMPKTLEEIMDCEIRYLDSYEKKPFRTDWRYFWRAFYNIVFKKARSA